MIPACTSNRINTPFAYYLGVDFTVASVTTVLDEPYATQYANKQLSEADLKTLLKERNNIATEYRITLIARKDRQR